MMLGYTGIKVRSRTHFLHYTDKSPILRSLLGHPDILRDLSWVGLPCGTVYDGTSGRAFCSTSHQHGPEGSQEADWEICMAKHISLTEKYLLRVLTTISQTNVA